MSLNNLLPIKKILCPIDFSDFSFQALDGAGELASHFGAELCVLHVTQLAETVCSLDVFGADTQWDMAGYERAMREGAESELQKVVKREQLRKIAVQPFLLEGYPADKIVGVAEIENVDLIVIATHGRSGWRHMVFGSVAERVIRLAPCPVLVIQIQKPDAN